MKDMNIKNMIDRELKGMNMSIQIKENIREKNMSCNKQNVFTKKRRIAAAVFIIALALGGTTAFAASHFSGKIMVNEEELPELEPMHIAEIQIPDAEPDEYGARDMDYGSYEELKESLGIHLLDSEMSQNNAYMQIHMHTDGDYAVITVQDYIIGDTSEFASPVSLEIDMMLSEAQKEAGFDVDYLGMYEFVGNYISEQGHPVNILEETVTAEDAGKMDMEKYVSEKIAIFVADGIRYTLTGRVPEDTLKLITDTME